MYENLDQKAHGIRVDILKMLNGCKSGHPGGSLSCVEIILALYEKYTQIRSLQPEM